MNLQQNSPPVPRLAVVVPVHNETGNIAPLIAEIRAALQGNITFEIIYVDDASTDDTPDALNKVAADCPELRILRHQTCSGQSAAIATGVRAARGSAIATLDGDGQNDPADIPALLAAFDGGDNPDGLLIAGLRAKRRDSWVKRLSSRIANGVRGRLLGDDTTDTGCGLKVFSRDAFLRLPHFNHMHRFLPALIIRAGGKVVQVPVNHRPRESGASKYGTLDRLAVGIVDLFGVIWLQRRGLNPDAQDVTPDRDAP
ncbi:MAG: glycosyltransferase family 2 protein [Rhodospirillaceae bacterium]|jgi:dolichol-phosphate mannosyltransferase|nr:glycosyltransferase family 2 protein [Rhodospirillaceae bacterium]MBT4218674.1 glycosyltransferase family 2 protein [Rhodospirillaceae bacterium]MBT5013248.1 glycosyltransferase family 2 protein [Rhodospirillaceae bacterium]MBT5309608.1 glycosyltransferase family 2 protein [Rhodospirillaceae bacterium]MBT6407519.1 glycosyltransferase family 2 protein [Rhodospirillaceae bacterium]